MPGATARRTRWLLREPSPDAALRVFPIPYSGCGASMYRRWPRFVGDIEVCPLQLPGRENRSREPSATSYPELADALAEALVPYLDRPYGLFGHCGSALAGYETAVRLTQCGHPPPTRLFVSSQVAPHEGPFGRFLGMTDAELVDELRQLVIQMGGTPVDSLLELSLGVLRADVEANKNYHVPDPVQLPVPITAIGWTGDVEVPHQLMTGWSRCGATTVELLTGEHYTFTEAPAALLALIARDLGAPARTQEVVP